MSDRRSDQKQPGFTPSQVQKIKGETAKSVEDDLIVEEPLEIRVNGSPYAIIMRTPGHDLELAAGFCLTEGIVENFDDVKDISHCTEKAAKDRDNIVNVTLSETATAKAAQSATSESKRRNLEARSACGLCGIRMLADLEKQIRPLPQGPDVPIKQIYPLQDLLFEHQKLFKQTSAAHGSILTRVDGTLIVVREDVGRHNTLDKAIGYCLLNKIDTKGLLCTISGRISFEMVQKALRAGIPILVSMKAATNLAQSLAEEFNVTLVGRLKAQQMNLYTHPERIIL